MAERKALGPIANGRNHAITGIVVALAAGKLYAVFPSLTEVEWQIIAGTVIGGVLGFGASTARSFAAARGGKSLASSFGKRLAQWVGCLAAVALLSGCGMVSKRVDWTLGAVETQQTTGPKITVIVADEGIKTTCEGETCKSRIIKSPGLSVPFTGFLGRIVDAVMAF